VAPLRPSELDRRAARWTASAARRTPAFHAAARAYSRTVYVHFGGWLTLGWWRAWRSGDARRIRAMVTVSTATTVAFAMAQAVSTAVDRQRPFADRGADRSEATVAAPVLAHRADSSFPSDHTTVAAAIAGGLWTADRPLGLGAALATVLLAADRLYLGVHYPTDVLAGALLGGATVAGTVRATRRPGPG